MTQHKPLADKVALVAGATRGTGRAFAVELARAGAVVYATGRSTETNRSEMDRPETIEGTEARMREAGGTGHAVACDHLDREQVRNLVARIESEQGRLDILVNDIWGGDHLTEWDAKVWEHDLDKGFRALRLAIDTHVVTSHYALPLLIKRPGGLVFEVTDGDAEFNADYRGTFFYDLAKVTPIRMALALSHELKDFGGTALALSPGWLRSEAMLDHFGVTEATWRDALAREPHFCISETPSYVARCAVAVAADPDRHRWNGTAKGSWDLAPAYGIRDLDGSQPHMFNYFRDIQQPDKPADPTGYR